MSVLSRRACRPGPLSSLHLTRHRPFLLGNVNRPAARRSECSICSSPLLPGFLLSSGPLHLLAASPMPAMETASTPAKKQTTAPATLPAAGRYPPVASFDCSFDGYVA